MADNEHLIKLLEEKVNEIEDVANGGQSKRAIQWKNEVLMILDNLISEDSKYYKQIEHLSFSPGIVVGSLDDDDDDIHSQYSGAVKDDMESAKGILSSIIYGIKNGLIK